MSHDKIDIAQWCDRLRGNDFAAMRLKYAGNEEAQYAIMQLECRKKAASKLPKILENKQFRFPTTLSAEQCTSELLARFHTTLVPRGARLLDMTCGLGVDSFELCQQCESVVAIDIDAKVTETANENAAILGISNFTALCGDSEAVIADAEDDGYTAIFVDPARRNAGKKVVFLDDCSPNVAKLIRKMLRVAPLVVIKASPMLDITAAAKALQNVSDVFTIGTPSECKELVIVCKRGYEGEVRTHAVTLWHGGEIKFSYDTVGTYNPDYATELRDGDYLYEPYPAVMKAGHFGELCQKFALTMLGRDTHIFTSHEAVERFPGKMMKILWCEPFNKRSAAKAKEIYPKANVSTRGFVMPAPQLAKYAGIAEGGDKMLYGVGLAGKRNHWIAVCE